jgi:acetyl-CoA acetyltransferase
MTQAYIVDALRTPIGRYGGALSSVRTDDLGAIPIRALMARHPNLDWAAVADVIYGCANQAGEDNRNVAHMAYRFQYLVRRSIAYVDRGLTHSVPPQEQLKRVKLS